MSFAILAAQRRRTFLLATTFLAPVLFLGSSAAKAQQASADQLPPTEVNPPGDQNRTRAKAVTHTDSYSRPALLNVSHSGTAAAAPAYNSNVASSGNGTTNRQFNCIFVFNDTVTT